jgi:hypothetical protein
MHVVLSSFQGDPQGQLGLLTLFARSSVSRFHLFNPQNSVLGRFCSIMFRLEAILSHQHYRAMAFIRFFWSCLDWRWEAARREKNWFEEEVDGVAEESLLLLFF